MPCNRSFGLNFRRRRFRREHLSIESLESRRLLAMTAMDSSYLELPSIQVDTAEYNPTRVLVRFREDANPSLEGLRSQGDVEIGNSFEFLPQLREIQLEEGLDVGSALKELRARPDVLYAEPDYRITVRATPNDASFQNLWGLHNTGQTGGLFDADIDASEAWDVTTGSGSVIVAVIDSGVDYTHPDLAANMWTNLGEIPGNRRDDDGNGYVDDVHGYDFVNRDGDPMDDFFHGTHVAGTIGAEGNNEIGVTGMSWKVQIMALKFLAADGGGYTSDAIEALNYAVANGAKISNNSWAGGPFTQSLYDAIRAAGSRDHIFVAAASNDGNNNDQFPAYPASYDLPNIISVAATDHNDQLAWFSNYGARTVDVGAPGVNILSTFPMVRTPAMQAEGLSAGYGAIGGTSMAAPHVSGLAALIMDQHPDWSSNRIIEQIYGTVDPLDALRRTTTGGRINAAAALGNPVPDSRGPRVTNSTPSGIVSNSVSSFQISFSEPVSDFTEEDIVSFVGPKDGQPNSNLLSEIIGVSGSGREYTISVNTLDELGNYVLVLGPGIFDESGNAMDQDSDGQLGEVPQDQFRMQFTISERIVFQSSNVPINIRDYTISSSFLTINQDLLIGDIDVQLDITHTYTGDLAIYLISPSDPFNAVTLSRYRGTSGENYRGTIFDDEANVPIASGSAPFSGSYRPESPLSQLDGFNARGVWELRIQDWGLDDIGQLNSWSLTIDPGDGAVNPDPGNNIPPEANDDYVQAIEDTPLVVDVLANDRDSNADKLTVTSVGQAFTGRALLNSDNTVTFYPDPNMNTNFASGGFTYFISDGRGGTAQAWAWIDILPVNDAPVAVDDFVQGSKNQQLVFSPNNWYSTTPGLESNDIDVDGDWLSVKSVGNAANGTVSIDPYGSIVFVPSKDFLGTASFEYTVTDGDLTDVGLVTIELADFYYLSTSSGGTLTNSDGSTIEFTGSDILKLAVGANGNYKYSMYFDGSDVGLTTASENIDAFTFTPDGSLLISTLGAVSVESFGYTVNGRGEDLLSFWPERTGNDTNGYWGLYFDGSNVGLTTADENVDAVSLLNDGKILISTSGPARVPGIAAAADEDVMVFTPYSWGENYTSGTWVMYFDGSDVGLGETDDEDVDALFVRESSTGGQPTLFFSTRGAFNANDLTGENHDIFAFNPTRLGNTTTGAYESPLTFDGSRFGLANFDLDGIYVGNFVSSYYGYMSASSPRGEGEASTSGTLPSSARSGADVLPFDLVVPIPAEGSRLQAGDAVSSKRADGENLYFLAVDLSDVEIELLGLSAATQQPDLGADGLAASDAPEHDCLFLQFGEEADALDFDEWQSIWAS